MDVYTTSSLADGPHNTRDTYFVLNSTLYSTLQRWILVRGKGPPVVWWWVKTQTWMA